MAAAREGKELIMIQMQSWSIISVMETPKVFEFFFTSLEKMLRFFDIVMEHLGTIREKTLRTKILLSMISFAELMNCM